ncbi:MAG: protein-disulfide reductase DsbD N-terminal domain-containing protein, partial [Gammaproteobacteria bacterium]|nr:protein-disulfide reductase DsbD N-terminal domain-containing protein [Gammaproteobacteria bacterium]
MRRVFQVVAAALGAFLATVAVGQDQDILKPEQAFRYTVTASADALLVRWTIEPEHYLYQERMSFESRTAGITLGPAVMPEGKLYTDEYFGEMHIYRGTVEIRLPIGARSAGVDSLALAVKSQGCADVGLCYPPQVWVTNVALPAAGNPPVSGRLSALLGAAASGGGPKDEPLPVEQAFRFRVEPEDPFTLNVSWQIAPGYYLYRHTLGAETTSTSVQLASPSLPPGLPKVDEEYGNTLVFYDEVAMTVPLTRSGPGAQSLPLTIRFQGCKEDSICYPPQAVATTVELPAATAAGAASAAAPAAAPESEQDRLFTLIRDGNLFAVMAMFAGLGLLL